MEARPLKQKKTLVLLAQSGVIAALYVALTTLLQPIGFGSVQCRIAEALTVLPVYLPAAIPGLTVGCFLSNLIGLATGANPAGALDLLLGTGATALAAALTYALRNVRLGNLPVAATIPPVLVNAVVVGAELYVVYGGLPLAAHMALVGIGQAVACIGGGLIVAAAVQKSGITARW